MLFFDWGYMVFGQVVEGFEVLDKLVVVLIDLRDCLKEDLKMKIWFIWQVGWYNIIGKLELD